jgi:hypothetical protein
LKPAADKIVWFARPYLENNPSQKGLVEDLKW